ncbi:cyclic diguanylate phosphodiesterase [Pantoea allii]|uniref:EAL domain-containing protein n=1 Tax=Pantoea allii TaxID=574096 RepID=UPI0039773071
MPLIKRKRDHARSLIVLAGLLPLLLGLLFTAIDARKTVKEQQVNTAATLLSQAEKISDNAWSMIASLRQYDDQSCDQVENTLRINGTLHPYFRGIGRLESDMVSCSSAYGNKPATLEAMIGTAPPVTGKDRWSLSLTGSYSVPDRPAVIFVRQISADKALWVMVEGQYLIDFMSALGSTHEYRITMRFNNGAPIVSGNSEMPGNHWLLPQIYKAASSRYPISVTLIAPSAERVKTWAQLLFVFMPMAAIFSVLFMILTTSWLRRRFSWGDEMRRAIRSRQFSVHYQPTYSCTLQRCSGAEALLRWTLPNGDSVRPDTFITAAEAEGMIIPVTHHLMDLIVEDTQHWKPNPGFHLAINVAAEHLQHPDFVNDMLNFAKRMAKTEFNITLELTERSLIKEGNVVATKLAQLRQAGMKVAIDDFGTGHCSLSYLQTFALDYLKIDQGFINAIESLEGETPVLDAIISLSHKLKLQVLGEGVETALQFRYLQQHGVTFVQGYFYARPMDNTATIAWMAQYGHLPVEVDNP